MLACLKGIFGIPTVILVCVSLLSKKKKKSSHKRKRRSSTSDSSDTSSDGHYRELLILAFGDVVAEWVWALDWHTKVDGLNSHAASALVCRTENDMFDARSTMIVFSRSTDTKFNSTLCTTNILHVNHF